MKSDDPSPRPDSTDDRFALVHEDETRSLDRRLGLLSAEVAQGFEMQQLHNKRHDEQLKFIEGLLLDLHNRLDRALNAVDGIDVRKRLAAVEEALTEKPKRQRAQKAK